MTSALPDDASPDDSSPSADRRRFLFAAASLAGVGARPAAARQALAAPVSPEGAGSDAGLLVAGPAGGGTDAWAERLGPALARALPQRPPQRPPQSHPPSGNPPSGTLSGQRLRRETAGGVDGVTGANRFEAQVAPDGNTALVVPGTAALAWLAGDPRARFEAARWVPALAAFAPGVIVARLPASSLAPGGTVRFATTGPAGPDLPALLALDLMGVAVQPVPVPVSSPEVLSQPGVDAVFLHGPGAEEAARTLAALGTTSGTPTLLGLGLPDATGRFSPPPSLPAPSPWGLPELVARTAGGSALHAAWRAAAVAAQLDAALVLPAMAPAAAVASWRRACAQAAAGPEIQEAAAGLGVQVLAAPACTVPMAALAVDPAGLLDLRRWLAGRHDWRSS